MPGFVLPMQPEHIGFQFLQRQSLLLLKQIHEPGGAEVFQKSTVHEGKAVRTSEAENEISTILEQRVVPYLNGLETLQSVYSELPRRGGNNETRDVLSLLYLAIISGEMGDVIAMTNHVDLARKKANATWGKRVEFVADQLCQFKGAKRGSMESNGDLEFRNAQK